MKTVLSIQALRALAALRIGVYQIRGGVGAGLWWPLGSGVDLFFVISGFVMVYSSERLFGERGAQLTFLRHRLARIVPLYWTVTTIWLLFGQEFDLRTLVGSYLFIPYNTAGAYVPLYGIGWTLNFEMFFYAVFTLCLFFRKARALTLLAGTLLTAVLIGHFCTNLPHMAWRVWTDPLILEFLMGAGIAALYRRGVELPGLVRPLMVIAALCIIWQLPEGAGGRWALWGIPAAAIVSASVLGSQRWLSGRLGKVAGMLGDASYSLYLLHILVWHTLRITAPSVVSPWFFAAGWMGAVVLSLVVYRYFERPITNALKKTAQRQARPVNLAEVAAE